VIDQQSLERAADRFRPPEWSFERLVLRRARKRRGRQIAAGLIGGLIALVSFASLLQMFRTNERTGSTPSPSASPLPESRSRTVEEIAKVPALLDEDASATAGPFAEATGWIALRSGSDLLAVDPTDPSRIVVLGGAYGADPIDWSADGARLLLSVRPDGWPDHWSGSLPRLEVMSADGSRVDITTFPGPPREPPAAWGSFSPDGRAVVYGCCGDKRGPYVIDLFGGSLRALGDPCPRQTVDGEEFELCGEPADEAAAWSPDGSRIAWFDFAEGTIAGAGHINVLSFINPDGSGLREGVARLTGTFGATALVWSPDGSRLAYWTTSGLDDGPGQIFVINADGSGLRQITHRGDNRWPTWSPDGTRIAFVRDGALFTMAADGSDVEQIEGVFPDGPIAWNHVG
jgi:Tol biopolymer transport system component